MKISCVNEVCGTEWSDLIGQHPCVTAMPNSTHARKRWEKCPLWHRLCCSLGFQWRPQSMFGLTMWEQSSWRSIEQAPAGPVTSIQGGGTLRSYRKKTNWSRFSLSEPRRTWATLEPRTSTQRRTNVTKAIWFWIGWRPTLGGGNDQWYWNRRGVVGLFHRRWSDGKGHTLSPMQTCQLQTVESLSH